MCALVLVAREVSPEMRIPLTIVRVPGRRQQASPVPVPDDGFTLFITNSDNGSRDLSLPFQVQIFNVLGSVLTVNTDGVSYVQLQMPVISLNPSGCAS